MLGSESRAAAVYRLEAIQPCRLKIGDNFVVCNGGGRTVDLISYRITQLSLSSLKSLEYVGSGGLCGEALLNFRFEDHVRSRIGAAIFQDMLEHRPKAWQIGVELR